MNIYMSHFILTDDNQAYHAWLRVTNLNLCQKELGTFFIIFYDNILFNELSKFKNMKK